ncbi:MAG TPA: Trm112 family protein [Candidatus Limnocylindria bacterium]|nr:Trm112 family protein [Candidatus Limnocylindria bacterium]
MTRLVCNALMRIDARLLADLVCPVDHSAVREDGEDLTCMSCGRRYPVRDGIPVMLESDAERHG